MPNKEIYTRFRLQYQIRKECNIKIFHNTEQNLSINKTTTSQSNFHQIPEKELSVSMSCPYLRLFGNFDLGHVDKVTHFLLDGVEGSPVEVRVKLVSRILHMKWKQRVSPAWKIHWCGYIILIVCLYPQNESETFTLVTTWHTCRVHCCVGR